MHGLGFGARSLQAWYYQRTKIQPGVPAILKRAKIIWGGDGFRPPADLPCGGRGGGGGVINQELTLILTNRVLGN